jgi:ribonuclease-3 family protein
MEESLKKIAGHFPLTEEEIKTYSPLSFAYIGDAVFDLIVRTMITTRGNTKPNKYHREVIGYVNAAAQAKFVKKIKPLLTEDEQKILKRGKNAKSPTTAKNQTYQDYRMATGFEALVGYLYLTGQMDRIMTLMNACFDGEE